MRYLKEAGIFTGGVIIGGISGCVILTHMVIKSKTFRKVMVEGLANATDNFIYGGRKKPYDRMSYQYFYDQGPKKSGDELIFASRGEAEKVLTDLDDIIQKYKFATVADLHELSGISSNFTDNKIGWASTNDMFVLHNFSGYTIVCPAPQPVDDFDAKNKEEEK